MSSVDTDWKIEESERFSSLSKVISHRLLSMTEGHALVQSLIHSASGYEAGMQLNIQYYGSSVARLQSQTAQTLHSAVAQDEDEEESDQQHADDVSRSLNLLTQRISLNK
eukprot:4373725-Amphidinium_carterae.4